VSHDAPQATGSGEFERRSRTGEDPLMYVDVNVTPTYVERIPLFEDDDLNEVAMRFAKKHRLKPKVEQKLRILLAAQRESVLGSEEEHRRR
jgi:hypothetical protein